mmetsp:Transcript_26496/g.56778  ORF Transcript_26496/g.56778 Transcript_26496/m.56778 type:complete len:324 (-) Transcript_26496:53-1024(-)
MDESTGLASGSVNGQRDTHGSLHEETVKNGSVVSVVIESVHQTRVKDGLRCVGSPDNTLVKIGNTELVVLLVKLPKDGVQALGGVVNGSRVSRVQNIGFSSSGKSDVNVPLGDFSSGCSVPVDTHGSQVNNVGIDIGVDDGAAQVVGSTDVVVNGESLGLGILLGVRGRALFGEVNNRVGLFVLDQLNKKVVFFGDIDVVEGNILSRNLLPCGDTCLRAGNRGQRITSQIEIDLSSAEVVDNDDIVTLVRQVKRSRPSAETVSSQNDNLLLFGRSVGSVLGEKSRCGWSGGDGLEARRRKRRGNRQDHREGSEEKFHFDRWGF